MKTAAKFRSLIKIMRTRFTGKRIPVAVRWNLTYLCGNRCKYCNLWQKRTEEPSTEQALKILDGIKAAGTERISFSGGDPLLRKDFDKIIDHATSLGLSCSINSCGSMIEQKIEAVKKLDLVKLSVDGPQEIHDIQKGEGTFERAMNSTDFLRRARVRYTFACTITKYNVEHLQYMLKLAQEHNTLVAFQPLKELYKNVENIDDISPDREVFKREIDKIIAEKKAGNRHIRNSLRGLYHIRDWPKYQPVQCQAGRIFCMIETDGRVTPCDRIAYKTDLPNAIDLGFEKALEQLPDIACKGCGFCGSLELNYIYHFKWDIVPIVNRISS